MSSPIIKSQDQYLGEMLRTFEGKIGVNDLNTGSTVLSTFEAVSQALYRTTGDSLSILRDASVDRAEGEVLKRIAADERIRPITARVATGKVRFIDTSFSKISSKVYAGANSPNVGSTIIKVSDASLFPSTGSIYIGRGTPNVEGPLAYSSVAAVGGYYEITLTNPTTKFHNISESVILSQGGIRNIQIGTVVRAVATGDSPDISFNVTSPAIILDGEVEVANVPISAQETGTDSNVPKNSIKQITTTLFAGATVINDLPVSNGRNDETDDELRERIKRARISKGLGTASAVKNSVLDAKAVDENATITSSEIFSFGEETTLYIDDGTGYEEKSNGVGLEFIVDSALGGEQYFQLATGGSQTSVAKAFLSSTADGPFNINPTDRLALLVGGVLSEHVFNSGDFLSNGSATAYEVVASINSDSELLFSATTANTGKRVVLSAKAENFEDLETISPTSGTDASLSLYLPTNEIETLRLYKNNKPLSKNGIIAQVQTMNQSDWSNTIVSGDTLILSVDGTNSITYTITDSDFLNEGTHSSVNKNNNLSAWVNVLNTKITGVTASISGNRIRIQSNLGANSRSAITIDPTSTLVTKGMFTAALGLTSTGKEADFILSRNTAQFKLIKPLAVGDSLTSGSEFTQGYVSSSAISGGSLVLATEANLWVLIDQENAEVITTGVVSDTLLSVTKPSANVVRYTSNVSTAFANVLVGDYVIIWSTELAAPNRLEGRVNAKTNTTLDLKVTPTEYAAATLQANIVYGEGFVVVRTDKAVQKVTIPAGNYNINTVAALLTAQIAGATVTVENDEIFNLTTDTKATTGFTYIITFDDSGKSFNFTEKAFSQSETSQFAFYESANGESSFPSFVHSTITDNQYSNPPTSTIQSFNSTANLGTLEIPPNDIISMLHPYGAINDNMSANESVQIDSLSGLTVNIDDSQFIKRLRANDRFYVARPYDFGADDTLVAILDSDPVNKTFIIPLYRKATTNTTMGVNANNFRAYDSDSGPTVEFNQFFVAPFEFKNYKVLMKAKNALNPKNNTVNEDSVLFRSARWGVEGNFYNVGYIYPTTAGRPLSHSIVVDTKINVRISLKSGLAVTNSIDGTTEWNITITPNSPIAGVDTVSYTWNTVGTNPAMGALAPGDFVTIQSGGEFSPENIGTFRIVSSTPTSFTVQRPNGVAVAESNIATLTVDVMSLYQDSPTTALEITDYVNTNLFDYLTAELLNDNGTTGAGIIDQSTYEDSGFTAEGVDLFDGINWLLSSNLPAVAPNPQFTFKVPLVLPSINTATVNAYTFNDGEEIRYIPTTAVQLDELLSILAVTGFTTLGEIDLAGRDSKLQLSTQILGSNGAIQVTGGTGNSIESDIINQASSIPGTELISVPVLRSLSGGIHADQWFRIAAENLQNKQTGISLNTSVGIVTNSPIPGQSIISLGNKENQDNYFGLPRKFFRDRDRTFHVEKHGSLVCISWDGLSASPVFGKTVNINDGGGAFVSVNFDEDNGVTNYTVTSGDMRFSEVGRGDKLITSAFANPENNGTFTVLGVSDNGLTVSVENTEGVDATAIAIAPSGITITATIAEGDNLVVGAPFSTLNQGKFRVIRRFENSVYIENLSAIEERVTVPANLRSLAFDGTTQFDVTVTNGAMVISWNTIGTQPDFTQAKVGDAFTVGTAFTALNQGVFSVLTSSTNSVTLANASAVAQTTISVTSTGADVLESHAPSLSFSEYETVLAGDKFVISGDVLGEDNAGTYEILEVLDQRRIVVGSGLISISPTVLSNDFIQVYVEEDQPYVGFKRTEMVLVDPSNSTRFMVVFDSKDQFLKINNLGGVFIKALSKLEVPETIKIGLDSYRYNTGLVAESNRIVYGDPRDNITYPGVAAAGAEIFTKPPLIRKIAVSIAVRINTGIPFNRVVEQVRNNIAALINSSPIGQSIAISDIVASVNIIPGVFAVSIASPSYDVSNDVIVINPSEKPLILNIEDVVVSKVGA